MSPGGRTALIVGGSLAVVGGTLGALWATGHLPFGTPSAPAGTPLIVPWPQDLAQAKTALVNLDVLWWQYWSANAQATGSAYQQQLGQEAAAIRAAYSGAGPAGGYTCSQLKTMGSLPASFTCPAYETGTAGMARGVAGPAFVVGSFLPAAAPGLLRAA